MALNGDALALTIVAALGISSDTGLSASEKTIVTDKWKLVCNADVTYRVANTQVIVASVSAVVPGVGVSGPGTGTTI